MPNHNQDLKKEWFNLLRCVELVSVSITALGFVWVDWCSVGGNRR